jgi:excisionase family DNA binding protein
MRRRANDTQAPRSAPLSLMTVPEVGEHLRISTGTVYRMLKRRSLPAFRLGGEWRFRIEDLERWLDENSSFGLQDALRGVASPAAGAQK